MKLQSLIWMSGVLVIGTISNNALGQIGIARCTVVEEFTCEELEEGQESSCFDTLCENPDGGDESSYADDVCPSGAKAVFVTSAIAEALRGAFDGEGGNTDFTSSADIVCSRYFECSGCAWWGSELVCEQKDLIAHDFRNYFDYTPVAGTGCVGSQAGGGEIP